MQPSNLVTSQQSSHLVRSSRPFELVLTRLGPVAGMALLVGCKPTTMVAAPTPGETRPLATTATATATATDDPIGCEQEEAGPNTVRDASRRLCSITVNVSIDTAPAGPDAGSATGDASREAPVNARTAAGDAGDVREDRPGMRLVPEGPFMMGADRGGQLDESPAHTVTLASFWLDITEVTNDAYEQCVSAGVCRAHDPSSAAMNHLGIDGSYRGPRQPISAISWDDARTYCRFVGKRLPTEAEWEKAARGTDGRRYPWGDESPTPELAVFGTNVTADVGSHPKGAGPYGHLDMAGNVWEWVEDIYDPYAYRRDGADRGIPGTCEQVMAAQNELRREGRQGFTGTNPIPVECERGLRGGAFNYNAPGLRSSNRVHHPARFRLIMSGFRCAADS